MRLPHRCPLMLVGRLKSMACSLAFTPWSPQAAMGSSRSQHASCQRRTMWLFSHRSNPPLVSILWRSKTTRIMHRCFRYRTMNSFAGVAAYLPSIRTTTVNEDHSRTREEISVMTGTFDSSVDQLPKHRSVRTWNDFAPNLTNSARSMAEWLSHRHPDNRAVQRCFGRRRRFRKFVRLSAGLAHSFSLTGRRRDRWFSGWSAKSLTSTAVVAAASGPEEELVSCWGWAESCGGFVAATDSDDIPPVTSDRQVRRFLNASLGSKCWEVVRTFDTQPNPAEHFQSTCLLMDESINSLIIVCNAR